VKGKIFICIYVGENRSGRHIVEIC